MEGVSAWQEKSPWDSPKGFTFSFALTVLLGFLGNRLEVPFLFVLKYTPVDELTHITNTLFSVGFPAS